MDHTLAVIAPAPGWRRTLGLEHLIMAGAMLALVVLVVLPLAFLLWGSVTAGGRLTLEHFQRAFESRLYYQARVNSLVLGAWTGLLSIVIGFPLAWAVSRTNVPFKGFVRLTVSVA